MQLAVITVTIKAVMVNEVGRCSGSNHSDDKSSDRKLSGVDSVAVITVMVNAVMVN